jgi:hypothetical protein
MRDGSAASENELDALARIVESGADDDDLADLSEGVLPPESQQSLTERAERDPALAQKLPAFLPLEASVRDAIAARVASDRKRSRRKILWLAAPALLAAAGVLLFVALSDRAEPLPAYALEVDVSAPALTRSGPARASIAREGSPLEILVRPAREVSGIHAAVFVREARGWTRLAIEPEIAPTGSVRVRGTIGRAPFDLGPGSHRIAVVVATHAASDPTARAYVLPLRIAP